MEALSRRISKVENNDLPMRADPPLYSGERDLAMLPSGESFFEEGEREWLPQTNDSIDGPRDLADPTPSIMESAEEPEWRRYRDTLVTVYRYFDNISPP